MKIRCISSDGGGLTLGKVYDVIEDAPSYYCIVDDYGIECGFQKGRFEVVYEAINDPQKPKKLRVKCIDNSNASHHFTIGHVYDVDWCDDACYYLVDDTGGTNSWAKERFEVVSEQQEIQPDPTPTQQSTVAATVIERPFDFDSYNSTVPGKKR